MTVDQVIEYLQRWKANGVAGDTPVIWEAISHSYDVDLKVTTRAGKTVVLVNA
jgi:hypothetical protein